jgi:hypothetical protein
LDQDVSRRKNNKKPPQIAELEGEMVSARRDAVYNYSTVHNSEVKY